MKKNEKEYTVPIEFVIVAKSKEAAYKKVLAFHKKLCAGGSYPKDCVESGISLANIKGRCHSCGGTGQGPSMGVSCPACSHNGCAPGPGG